MSTATTPETFDVTPFLNPAHWDGHMVGDGHPTDLNPELYRFFDIQPATAEAVQADAFAHRALSEYFNDTRHADGHSPLEIYTSGAAFELAEWPEGTIVFFDRELLRASMREGLASIDDWAGLPVPDRPSGLRPQPESSLRGVHRDVDGTEYQHVGAWGVVVPGKGRLGLERIMGIEASVSRGTPQQEPKVSRTGFVSYPVPVRIGEIWHPRIHGELRVERVNELQVCRRGLSRR